MPETGTRGTRRCAHAVAAALNNNGPHAQAARGRVSLWSSPDQKWVAAHHGAVLEAARGEAHRVPSVEAREGAALQSARKDEGALQVPAAR